MSAARNKAQPYVLDRVRFAVVRIRNSWSLLEVVLHGTATAAQQLAIPVAGKTGTTNDFTDAWFVGFSRSTTCGVWVGFDEKISLGNKETGAVAALPIWMSFMKAESARSHSIRDFPPVPLDSHLPASPHFELCCLCPENLLLLRRTGLLFRPFYSKADSPAPNFPSFSRAKAGG